ncbi:MAG TPA: cytochrome c, partial [Gemmatimonadales bacterium]|nr:cytochrome c [Gemmatimonadales bacterium]
AAMLFALTFTGSALAQQVQDSTRSTKTGVYTASQATKGGTLYALNCVSCHTPASHAGPAFAAKWDGRPLVELFDYVRSAMPKSDPGSLTQREYIQVLAYLLKMNGLPAGAVELPTDSLALRKIRIELKPPADSARER